MVLERAIKTAPALVTERRFFAIGKLLFQPAQQALVIDAHGFEEIHFELLAITAQLCRQTVPLALQLLLGDLKATQFLKGLLTLQNLVIGVLVVANHSINFDLIFSHHSLHFVAFSLAFTTVALVFKRHKDCIFITFTVIRKLRILDLLVL